MAKKKQSRPAPQRKKSPPPAETRPPKAEAKKTGHDLRVVKSLSGMGDNNTMLERSDVIGIRGNGADSNSIPSIVKTDKSQYRKDNANFVLLIEKGAVWRRFNKDRFWAKW